MLVDDVSGHESVLVCVLYCVQRWFFVYPLCCCYCVCWFVLRPHSVTPVPVSDPSGTEPVHTPSHSPHCPPAASAHSPTSLVRPYGEHPCRQCHETDERPNTQQINTATQTNEQHTGQYSAHKHI